MALRFRIERKLGTNPSLMCNLDLVQPLYREGFDLVINLLVMNIAK